MNADYIEAQLQELPVWLRDRARTFFSHVSLEVQERCRPGSPAISSAEYKAMKVNSFERKFMQKHLTDTAFLEHLDYCRKHISATTPGDYGLPEHYDHYVITDGIDELHRRFLELRQKHRGDVVEITEGLDLSFMCPGCAEKHIIHVRPGSGWTWNGDTKKPTISPSVSVGGVAPLTDEEIANYAAGRGLPAPVPRTCHSFVVNGRIEFLADSTHKLAGQTVDLPEIGE